MRFLERNVEIQVNLIDPSPFQPRVNFNLEELEDSVKQDGIVQRLIVRKKDARYELIDGERRLRIAKKLGFATVRCDIIEATDEEAARLTWTLNIKQKDYAPQEKALFFKKMQEKYGYSLRKIARIFSIDHATVINYLNVLKLPEKYQQLVWEGKIGLGIIRELMPLFNNISLVTQWLDKVVAENLTREDLKEALKSGERSPPPEIVKPEMQKLREEIRKEVEEELLSKPRILEKAWEKSTYKDLCERFPFLKENKDIVSEKALKPVTQAFMKGKALAYQHLIMQDIKKEVEKRKPQKKRLTSKDIAKILSKYAYVPSAEKTVAEDPEYEEALKYYPIDLVEKVWQQVAKTKRMQVLKAIVKLMYNWLEHKIDEIISLALKKC